LNKRIDLIDFKLSHEEFYEKYSLLDTVYWQGLFLSRNFSVTPEHRFLASSLEEVCKKERLKNREKFDENQSVPDYLNLFFIRKEYDPLKSELVFLFKIKNTSNAEVFIDEYLVDIQDPLEESLFKVKYVPIQYDENILSLLPNETKELKTRVSKKFFDKYLSSDYKKKLEEVEKSFFNSISMRIEAFYLSKKRLVQGTLL